MPGVNANGLQEIAALLNEKASWTPVQSKIESQLIHALKAGRGQAYAARVRNLRMDVVVRQDGRVLVDLQANVTPELLALIQRAGGEVVRSSPQYQAVRALVPVAQLETLASSGDVRFIRRAVQFWTNTGSITSQGDVTHRAALARGAFGTTGAGVKVGVLSDSVDFLSRSQGSGDLGPVIILPGQGGGGSGEGTAMLEIIHDLAPDAHLYFATADNGEASFAQNILNLRSAGCDIIVDDVGYFDESPFQDGIVAQAVNSVTASGALYFSSAGNAGNKDAGTSGTWEGDFVDGGTVSFPESGRIHSFGTASYNTVTAVRFGFVNLFWADPLGASTNDYDLFVLDASGSTVLGSSMNRQTGTQDPYEFVGTLGVGDHVVIVKASGAARFLHLSSGRDRLSINTPGATLGHAAAVDAFCVAAVDVATAFPGPFAGGTANPVEAFSSDGPRHVFFDAGGAPVTPGDFSSTGGAIRQKPDIAAADGVATTFPSGSGLNPFFGTSAAAPHVAAIAALLLSHNHALTPSQIRNALTRTALDIGPAGVDRDSGAGIVMAYEAFQRQILVTLPASATEGDGLLPGQGRVSIVAPPSADLTVTLVSSNANDLVLPVSVKILAGTTNAAFDVTILDDALLDGTQTATVAASAAGYGSGVASIAVYDNETAVLSVNLPASSREGDAPVVGTVMVSAAVGRDVAVNLAASDTTEVQVPLFVVVPMGQTSAVFNVTIVDDTEIDGSRTAMVTAHVQHWTDGSATILVLDNDTTNLALSVPAQTSETAGIMTNAGSVLLTGTLQTNLTVSLSSSDPSRLAVPGSVTILAGQTSAAFNLTPVNNALHDGSEVVSLGGQAPGFGPGLATVTVYDDESPPPPSNPYPPDLSSNVPVQTILSWTSGAGESMLNGGFESGDFTGWHQANTGAGDFVINNGNYVPPGGDSAFPPFSGSFSVVSSQTGAGHHVLYQDVSIPSTITIATLSWTDRIRNHAGAFAADQYFRVEIRSVNDSLREVLYTTQPGDPLFSDWVTRSFDVTRYAGQTLRVAWVEEDNNGYFNVHVDNMSLLFQSAPVSSFDLYFGSNPAPGPAELLGNTTNTTWALPPLAPLTTYYWQVVAHGLGATPGPVWRFITRGVDHFEWSAISSPQVLNQPFSATVTAKDEFNTTVSNFTGQVALSAGAGGAATPNTILASPDPTSSGIGGDYTDGYSFTPNTNLTVTHVRHYFGSKVSLWTESGTLLAAQNVISVPGTWVETPLPAPVVLLAGATYRVGVYSSSETYYWRSDLPGVFPDGSIDQSYESSGDTFPNLSDAPRWWFVDLRYTAESSIPLALSPTNSGNFTNGVWIGNIAVGDVETTVHLQADDGFGHTGQSKTFAVLAPDDIAVTVLDSPDPVAVGANLSYTIQVLNSGPATATGVSLTNVLPANATLVSFSSSQGSCASLAGTIQCSLGTLTGGGAATVTVVVTPSTVGSMTNLALVSRLGPDPYVSNNTAVTVTAVTPPSLSIGDVSVAEGDLGTTPATFAVVLSGSHTQTLSVSYATGDGTAHAGLDYTPTNGILTFVPGVSTQTVTVLVQGDTLVESDEKFFVSLSSPVNGVVGRARGVGTILNDDGLPGRVHHFTWDPVSTPQFVNVPFAVTIRARDAFDATVTNFASSVALSGSQGGGAKTNMILGDVVGINSSSGDWTFGYSFTPNTNLVVTHVRHYYGTKVSIWTDAGALLASQPVSSTPGTWRETPLANPLPLSAGSTYRVACYTGGGNYYWRNDLPAGFADGTINQSYEVSGDGFPANSDGTRWWFVDLRCTVDTSLPVALTPAVSGNFTNGVWSGPITVLEPAANMVVVADDGDGRTGSSTNFAVLLHDDLGVTVTDTPDPVALGGNLTYTIVVTNVGPSVATSVSVTNVLPASATFISVVSSKGACANAGGTVSCALGALAANTNVVVMIVVTAPSVPAIITNQVSVSRGEADTYAGNNSVVTVTGVQPVGLSINDFSVVEGDSGTTNALFTVQLSPPASNTVQVNYATVNLTATAGTDYQATNGTLAFLPGETSKTISVAVVGDIVWEYDETFQVNLSSPVNAQLVRSQGTGTILNDDPFPSVSISDVSVVEGNVGTTDAVFTVSVFPPSSQTITVYYSSADGSATAPSDYVALGNGQLTFNPLQTNVTISVRVIGDTLVESNETFFVYLNSANNATIDHGQAVGTIVNDDGLPGNLDHFTWDPIPSPQSVNLPFAVTITAQDAFNATVSGFTGTVNLAVSGVGGAQQVGGVVPYFSDNGPSLTGPEGPITQAGFTPLHVADITTLPLNNYGMLFIDEVDNASVSAVLLGRLAEIRNWVNNGGSLIVHDRSAGDISPNPFLLGTTGIATVRADTSNIDVIPPGANLVVAGPFGTIDNTTLDGGTSSAHGYVARNQLPPSASAFLSIGGDPNQVVAFSYPLGFGQVYYSTIPLDCYLAGGGCGGNPIAAPLQHIYTPNVLAYVSGQAVSISIAPTNSGNFINGVWSGGLSVLEPATNTVLLADDGSGHRGSSTNFAVLLHDDLGVTVTDSPDPVAPGESLAYTVVVTNIGPSLATAVTLTNVLPAGVTFVSVVPSQGTCANAGGTISCALGALAANTRIVIALMVTAPSAPGTLTNRVSVSRAEVDPYAVNNSVATVTAVRQVGLSVSDTLVREGDSGTTNAVFTVQLSPPTSKTVSVNYATANGTASADSDYLATNGTLIFLAGETNKTIAVPVLGDIVWENDETLQFNLSGPINAVLVRSQATGTILNDDSIPGVSISKASVVEGNVGTANAVFTVSVFPPSSQAITVFYYTADGDATAASDYVAIGNGQLAFNPLQTNDTISVSVNGDTLIEPDETFFVQLSGANNANITQGLGVGTIVNDDGFPGQVDHFAWDLVPSPQSVNVPFAVTITAQDAFNATAVKFSNHVALNSSQGGGARTNTILGDVVGINSGSGDFTLGYSFTPTTNFVVTHVRHYSGTKVSIWTDAGALLASQSVSSTPGTWLETPLTTPLPLTAGSTYRVACYSGGGSYYWRNDLPGVFADGTINQSYEMSGDGFPANSDGNRWWFVDLRYRVGSAQSLAQTPMLSGNFTNGVWSGPITVLEPATNLVVVADDEDGHTGSSTNFAVLLHDDLGVTVSDSPDPVAVGEGLTYLIVVTNIGPSAATGVTLTNLLPANSTFVSAAASQGACDNTGGTVSCALGTLAANTSVFITVVVTAPLVPAIITNRVSVFRGESDNYAGNNSAEVVTAVQRVGLSINDTSVVEGDSGTTNAIFTVQLSPPTSKTVQVNYGTVNLTATASTDYLATNGTLVFLPGETNKSLSVTVLGDITWEPDEMFVMNLTSPVNAVLVRSHGTNVILNDDAFPNLSVSDASVVEGNVGTTNAVFTVSVFPPSSQPITVQYYTTDGSASSPGDYLPISGGQLSVVPGQTNATISVVVKGDTLIEPDETFYVYLYNVNNANLGDSQGVGTIVNDDGFPGQVDHFAWDLVPSPQSVSVPFTVTITAQDAFNAAVTNFASTVALSGNQGGGARTNMILGNVAGINSSSGDLTFGYSFTPNTNLVVTHVRHYYGTKVSIWTDAGVLLTGQLVNSSPGTWRETPLAKPLSLTAGTTYRVACYTGGGNYYWRNDLSPGFGDGTIIQSYEVSGDQFPANSDGARWWFVDLRYTVGTSLPVALTPAVSGNFTNGVWSGPLTVLEPATNLVMTAGDGDGHAGSSTNFVVLLHDDLGVTMTGSPDPVVVGESLTYLIAVTNIGPSAASGVTLTNLLPANSAFVSVASSQGACANAGGTVSCALGTLAANTNVVITVMVTAPSVPVSVTSQVSVFRTEADNYAGNNSATVVTAVQRAGLSINDTAVVEGDSGLATAIFNVQLSLPLSKTVQVNYATANLTASAGSDYMATNGTVVLLPGETNKTISVAVFGDIVWELDETFMVILSNPINAVVVRSRGTNTILNDDPFPSLSIADASVVEGDLGTTNAVFRVRLYPPSSQAVTVQYYTADGTATAPADYVALASGQLTFNPGQTNATISVGVRGDTLIESDETFFVNLYSPNNASLTTGQGTGTILNDDGLPGHVDHFAWDLVPSPQYVNQPFAATITAEDAFDATVNSFTNTVTLSGLRAGGSRTGMILGNVTVTNSASGSYTLGYSFTPNTNLVVTHVRHYWGTKVSIWTDAGVLLASQVVSSSSGSWVETALPTPLQLSAGSTYRVACYSGGGNYYWRNDLPGVFADGTINQSCEMTGDGFPANFDGTRWWFVDLRYSVGTSQPVALMPAVSGIFNNGVWSGTMTVLAIGTNVQLKADDRAGHSSFGNAFNVYAAGDLALTMSGPPGPLLTNSPVTYLLSVFNPGPAAATGVVLSNLLPVGASFVSVLSSQGSCSIVGSAVTCSLGTVAGNTNATVQILATAPSTFGNITNQASVAQNEADPNLANNKAFVVTSVPNFPPTVSITSPGDGATFQFPLSLPLLADASDPDGFVTKVEFFDNGAKVGESTSSPFSFTWTNPPPGLDLLTARATDNAGNLATSGPVAITVLPPPLGSGIGLFGQYFDNINFTGATVIRVDPQIVFDLNPGFFPPFASSDTFSVRWSGVVQPLYSDNYTFTTYSDDGVRLYINGQLVINNFTDHSPTLNNGNIALQAGQLYSVVMEYYQNLVGAEAYLYWSSTNQSQQIIPQSQLYPVPAIASGPVSTNVAVGSNLTFKVLAYGEAPLSYQWWAHGTNLPGATATNLLLPSLQPPDAGAYWVVVSNIYGAVTSSVANVNVGVRPTISQDPQSQIVLSGSNVTFSVSATGTLPLSYRWRRPNLTIPVVTLNASNSSYYVPNAQTNDALTYNVIVTNAFGTASNRSQGLSSNALLSVVSSATADVLAGQGSNVTFSIIARSPGSLNYQWIFKGSNVATDATNVSLTLSNLQTAQQGDYWAVVSNGAGAVTTLVARLTVVPLDSDGDGMSDDWEIAHGFNPHDAGDASADADGDKMSNLEEYIAGTDPHDPLSVLKVQLDPPDGGGALIRFPAMPNISYTLQYRTNLSQGQWLKLQDVPPQASVSTVTVPDPGALPGTRRYYRIATPRQP